MLSKGVEGLSSHPLPTLATSGGRGATRAVVLVLHGGKAVSREVVTSTHLSALRMLPFAWAIRRRTRRQGVEVWRLRYRYRGWNGAEASPVADARWALDEVRQRHGAVPVIVMGHSMGGRVAAYVADDLSVQGLVLLAPWLTAVQAVRVRQDLRVNVLHGDQDRITSSRASAAWAERARWAGAAVTVRLIPGGEHFMLRHFRLWHRLAVEAVVSDLAAARTVPPAETVSPQVSEQLRPATMH